MCAIYFLKIKVQNLQIQPVFFYCQNRSVFQGNLGQFLLVYFQILYTFKNHTYKFYRFLYVTQKSLNLFFILKVIFKSNNAHKKSLYLFFIVKIIFKCNNAHKKSLYLFFILKIIFKSNNAHKSHPTNPPNKYYYYENKYFFMIFVVINQTNKHKAKIYDHYTYTQIIIKKFHNYSKKFIII